MVTAEAPTLLVLTPLSGASALVLPYYAGRALTQSCSTIKSINGGGGSVAGSLIRRDINFNAIDMTNTRYRKYASVISCREQVPPAFDDAWEGLIVQVDCAFEFNYPTGGTAARTAVSGSERTEGPTTFYRPSLTMIVTGMENSFDEWSAMYNWKIELQEV